jgi:hypothetical protein
VGRPFVPEPMVNRSMYLRGGTPMKGTKPTWPGKLRYAEPERTARKGYSVPLWWLEHTFGQPCRILERVFGRSQTFSGLQPSDPDGLGAPRGHPSLLTTIASRMRP